MIDPLVSVTHVKALPGFKLHLRFSDGADGVFDCSGELWGEVFEPLKDPKYFAKVFLDHGAPSWPNGADFDPGKLREDIEPKPGKGRLATQKLKFKGKPRAVAEEPATYAEKPAGRASGLRRQL